MKWLTKEQEAYFTEIRNYWDKIIAAIPCTSEAEFNENAAAINEAKIAIRVWFPGKEGEPRNYNRGDIRIDPADGVPYWAMHDHSSVAGTELQPSLTPTIWAHCHGTSAETAREFVSEGHNPYQEGHYCKENDKVYLCKMNNIVYAPSVYPQAWEEA